MSNPLFKAIGNFLAEKGIDVAEHLGEELLETTLQGWHDSDKDEYDADMPVLLSILTRIKKKTDATPSKWDNPFVDTLVEAVAKSIAANAKKVQTDDDGAGGSGPGSDTPPVGPNKP